MTITECERSDGCTSKKLQYKYVYICLQDEKDSFTEEHLHPWIPLVESRCSIQLISENYSSFIIFLPVQQ